MLPVRTILHPTDFSERSRAALRLACAVARDYGARLVILHVTPAMVVSVPFVTIPPEPADVRDKLLEELAQLSCPDPKFNVERLLREGDPVTEILNVAREIQCDLIVQGLRIKL